MKSSNSHQKKRFAFTCDEDDKLRELVSKYGEDNWSTIASKMRKRSTRKCRDRWINYLSPLAVNGTWSPEEDRLLYEKVEMYGRKWKFLTQFFYGRTDINIKNHFNFLQKKAMKTGQLTQSLSKNILSQKPLNNASNIIHNMTQVITSTDENSHTSNSTTMINLHTTLNPTHNNSINHNVNNHINNHMNSSHNMDNNIEAISNSIQHHDINHSNAYNCQPIIQNYPPLHNNNNNNNLNKSYDINHMYNNNYNSTNSRNDAHYNQNNGGDNNKYQNNGVSPGGTEQNDEEKHETFDEKMFEEFINGLEYPTIGSNEFDQMIDFFYF
ncbi:hypothetical protein TRFO_15931 [Tritrichomonas foetus]|uniref:Myb-like DNA-binding domain containing protein n=1 Tax=Tritrichomonas foetus TaxID=1144522 RepID=A0A1J4KVT9_9EUKA|nr:hypothetical protein TRFO_15931 [Tritrichomonas foetus]|eukprot:OHT13814.1 hypothetical protein TRFO_15931 [Tritrichomonas foetus]